jgi:hypothetical protein
VDQNVANQNINITNSGEVPVTVQIPTITGAQAGNFQVVGFTSPQLIQPDAEFVFQIRFTATAPFGDKNAVVTINSSAPGNPATVSLTGYVITPVREITVSPTNISFNPVDIGQTTPTRTVTITNTGDVPATVQVPTVVGDGAANFPLSDLPNVQQVIQPGLNIVFQVGFNAIAPIGVKEAVILVVSDAGNHQVFLSGTVTQAPTFLIHVSHPEINFGQVLNNANVAPRVVTLSNIGNQPLNILSVVLSNETNFPTTGIPAPHHILASGAHIPISIGLNTVTLGQKAETITITHNANNMPNPIVVPLAAFVARHDLTIIPNDKIDFNSVVFGETVTPHTVTITNTGNVTATVHNVILSGTHAGDFRLANHPTSINPIAPGGNVTFTVYHTPTAVGARTALITITDDVPTTNVVVAGMNGVTANESVSFNIEVKNSLGETVLSNQTVGEESVSVEESGQALRQTMIALTSNVLRREISVEPMAVDFGEVEVDVAAEPKTVTIRNTGTAELTIQSIVPGGANVGDFGFDLPTVPLHLAPNAYRVINVSHTATAEGMRNATITITGNMTGAITVTLRSVARVVSEDSPVELPTVTELRGNFPNPFNPETTIVFALAKESPVTIEIINVRGQRVRTLVNQQHYGVGEHRVIWDGRDENGSPVASGMYFYRMVANEFSAMNRMILMK